MSYVKKEYVGTLASVKKVSGEPYSKGDWRWDYTGMKGVFLLMESETITPGKLYLEYYPLSCGTPMCKSGLCISERRLTTTSGTPLYDAEKGIFTMITKNSIYEFEHVFEVFPVTSE